MNVADRSYTITVFKQKSTFLRHLPTRHAALCARCTAQTADEGVEFHGDFGNLPLQQICLPADICENVMGVRQSCDVGLFHHYRVTLLRETAAGQKLQRFGIASDLINSSDSDKFLG